jgi:hypothetical protein
VDAVDDCLTGALVPSSDTVGLRRAVEALLDDAHEARARGSAATNKARSSWGARVAADALAQTLRDAAG